MEQIEAGKGNGKGRVRPLARQGADKQEAVLKSTDQRNHRRQQTRGAWKYVWHQERGGA